MSVAERGGQSIGGVLLGLGLHPKHQLHHVLHLGLIGTTMADHCLLDVSTNRSQFYLQFP